MLMSYFRNATTQAGANLAIIANLVALMVTAFFEVSGKFKARIFPETFRLNLAYIIRHNENGQARSLADAQALVHHLNTIFTGTHYNLVAIMASLNGQCECPPAQPLASHTLPLFCSLIQTIGNQPHMSSIIDNIPSFMWRVICALAMDVVVKDTPSTLTVFSVLFTSKIFVRQDLQSIHEVRETFLACKGYCRAALTASKEAAALITYFQSRPYAARDVVFEERSKALDEREKKIRTDEEAIKKRTKELAAHDEAIKRQLEDLKMREAAVAALEENTRQRILLVTEKGRKSGDIVAQCLKDVGAKYRVYNEWAQELLHLDMELEAKKTRVETSQQGLEGRHARELQVEINKLEQQVRRLRQANAELHRTNAKIVFDEASAANTICLMQQALEHRASKKRKM